MQKYNYFVREENGIDRYYRQDLFYPESPPEQISFYEYYHRGEMMNGSKEGKESKTNKKSR